MRDFLPLSSTRKCFGVLIALGVLYYFSAALTERPYNGETRVPIEADRILHSCREMRMIPVSSPHTRAESDRFVPGTVATLLRNATLWTGWPSHDEHMVIQGDILLSRGLIKYVGDNSRVAVARVRSEELKVIDVHGAWVTPGIVDIHSHMGVAAIPALLGADDLGSLLGNVQPWLRSLDGLNTHDEAYKLSIAGGVTTSLVIPGSSGSIGGQGFVIKLRATAERSPFSKLLEPPFTYNGSGIKPAYPPRWRHLKQACGENPHGLYGANRMDSIWAFRYAYNEAKKILDAQNDYCARAEAGQWRSLGTFPQSLQWEALVDVMRGRVKVHTHCYEAVDLDGLVRLSNEFKFPIAAFHHAHETYLVPDLLKKSYGHPPASAMFAAFSRYKREAYRHSEFAPKILHQQGLQVIMKSDHPGATNSRDLMHEAQQAHYYGLPPDVALASVTSTPADVLGLSRRIGYLREGFDADVVVWDSHPLALGATPAQVYIDGIPQLESPTVMQKSAAFQTVPDTPDFSKEAADAVHYEGLPPLEPHAEEGAVLFQNVRSVWGRAEAGQYVIHEATRARAVLVRAGRVVCDGDEARCAAQVDAATVIDLEGGVLAPGLLSYGTPLGLEEINAEPSTTDGPAPDPLTEHIPPLLGAVPIIRAVDGLQFGTRNALLAYRSGITTAVTHPQNYGFLGGIGAAFSLGALSRLSKGAILRGESSAHVSLAPWRSVSVSTQIAALRRALGLSRSLDRNDTTAWPITAWLMAQPYPKLPPLVVEVNKADIMATVLELKKEFDQYNPLPLNLVFAGAAEAHLLADQIAAAGVGVIVNARPYPETWDSRRIIERPPLSNRTAIGILLEHHVTVGLGIFSPRAPSGSKARNTRFDLGWVALEAGLSKETAMALATTNLETLLGLDRGTDDLVAYRGGSPFDFSGKPIAVLAPDRGLVDIFD